MGDRAAFRSYLPIVELTLQRVRSMKQDSNAGAYYKVAGELKAFAEDYAGASALLGEAVNLFKTEEEAKIGSLIIHCNELKSFCDKQNLQKTPATTASAAPDSAADPLDGTAMD